MDTALDDRDFLRFRDHGDVEALARFFDAAAPRLLLIAAHLVRHVSDAEDLVQVTFIEALRNAQRFTGEGSVLAWMAVILRRRAADHLRTSGARPERLPLADAHGDELPSREPNPLDATANEEFFDHIVAAVERIESPFREVLALRLVHGLEPSSIAHTLGRAPGTVRMQLKRGLEKLRERLPASLGGALGAALATLAIEGRGLASVRELVLAEAAGGATAATVSAALTTSAPPTLALSSLAKHGLVAAAVVLATVVVWFARNEPAPPFEATETARATELAPSAAEPANGTTLELAPAPAAIDARAPLAAGAQTPAPQLARIRGVLLRHDGAPAVDAKLVLHGWPSNDERVELDGMPATPWEDVLATPNADGSFELAFDPPRAFQFTLDASAPWAVSGDRRWSTRRPGSVTDLGTLTLPLGGRVEGRVVTASGEVAPGVWRVLAKDYHPSPWRSQWESYMSIAVDRDTGAFVFDGVAPGRVELELSSGLVPPRTAVIDVRAGETSQFEFVYDGPPADRRLGLRFADHFSRAFGGPSTTNLELRSVDGAQLLPGSIAERHSETLIFTNLEPGEHVVVVTDPRFEPFVSDPIENGGHADLHLTGSVELTLVVTCDGRPVEDARFDCCHRSFHDVPWFDLKFDVPFVRKVEPGTYVFATVPDAQEWHVMSSVGMARQVDFTAGFEAGSKPVAAIELTPARSIQGRVVDMHGVPVRDVEVCATAVGIEPPPIEDHEAWNAWQLARAAQPSRRARTDAAGAFELGRLAEGNYDVFTDHDNRIRAMALAVPANSTDVELRLGPTGRIVGRVEPEFVRRYEVSISTFESHGGERLPARLSSLSIHTSRVEIEADGTFVIEHAPVGRTELQVRLPRASRVGLGWSTSVGAVDLDPIVVDVRADSTTEVVVEVAAHPPVVARVRLVDVRESGLHLQVVATRVDDPFDGHGAVAAGLVVNGVAEVAPITPGRWRFAVESPEQPWTCPIPGEHDIDANETFELDFDLEIVPGKVTVLDAHGLPMPGAVLRFLKPNGWQTVTADSKGELELALPPGTHVLQPDDAPHRSPLDESVVRKIELVWTSDGPAEPVLVIPPPE